MADTITTFEAAELLGLRHSAVVDLLAAGELASVAADTERPRLRLVDVLAYREELHERRSTFIAETTDLL